jgi:hypothetical protein
MGRVFDGAAITRVAPMTTDVPLVPLAAQVALTVFLGAAGVAVWARRRPTLAGTTLVAPWRWTLLALAALSIGQIAVACLLPTDAGWASHVRYLSAIVMLCPAMAVLGAKRPQDRAWQLIVLALLVILALPSVESLLHRPGAMLQIHAARHWFLAVLIIVGLVNGLATRHGIASATVAASQALLLFDHLPWPFDAGLQGYVSPSLQGLAGMGLWVAGLALLGCDVPRRGHVANSFDRLWLDFRDLFGAVWALRVAERINAASHMYGWGVRVNWRGLQAGRPAHADGKLTPEVEEALLKMLPALLRRFVSAEWIATRMSKD